MSKNTEKTTKKINLSINSCQFIAVVFGCKIQIKGKHALTRIFSYQRKVTRVGQITYKTRLLPPCSLIVDNVFFIVLPKNR